MIEETRAAEIEGLGAALVLVSAAGAGEHVPDAPTALSEQRRQFRARASRPARSRPRVRVQMAIAVSSRAPILWRGD